MPSARRESFSGGGFLRDKDGTFVGLRITEKNPLWTGEKPKGKSNARKNDDGTEFRPLFAVIAIQEDNQEQLRVQPMLIGDANSFQPTEDGLGVIGAKGKNFSKGADFTALLESLYEAGMPNDFFPDSVEVDDDNESVDFSNIVGVRARFNWRKNDKKTKKLGQREVKGTDGRPTKKFDREDLIVTNFYNKVDVTPAILEAAQAAMTDPKAARESGASKPAAAQPASKRPAGKTTNAKAAPAIDVVALATSRIIDVLSKAKDFTMSDAKLSVALLNSMGTDTEANRNAVRQWALVPANLQTLVGTEHVITTKSGEEVAVFGYDAAKKMVSLAVAVAAE